MNWLKIFLVLVSAVATLFELFVALLFTYGYLVERDKDTLPILIVTCTSIMLAIFYSTYRGLMIMFME